MDHFAGLDVSVKETSICIVDDAGKIVREVKVASDPEADMGAAVRQFTWQRLRRSSCAFWRTFGLRRAPRWLRDY